MSPTLAVVIVAAIAALVVYRAQARRLRLTELRDRWGAPRDRAPKVDVISEIWRARIATMGSTAYLDDRTWADLNLDDVFAAIDRTESTLGQEALYHRLRSAPVSDHVDAFEALMDRMASDASTRERAMLALSRLQDRHGYNLWWLGKPSAIELRPWYALFPLLTVSTIAAVIATIIWHEALPVLIAVVAVDLLVRVAAAGSMDALARAIRQVAPVIATGQQLTFLQGDTLAPLVGNVAADVAALRPLKTIARWASADPLMLSVETMSPAYIVSTLVSAVYEYVNMVFLFDGNAVFFGTRGLQRHRESLLRLVDAIGNVDAALSVASWRAERDDWTRPLVTASGTAATFSDIRHPLVDDAVGNGITLNPGRGALITGSNMSGKSTFLRTVGVNAVLAQTINTCLAARYEAPVFHVQSCIGRADDLLAGKSYYLVEVEQVLSRVRASGSTEPHLFLFDELFRGTNAAERVAAAEAVLREMLQSADARKVHVVLAATHDGELVEMLHDLYAPYHFSDSLGEEGLTFDYHLRSGPSTTRNAITLLSLNGAPASLVNRAVALAEALDRKRSAFD